MAQGDDFPVRARAIVFAASALALLAVLSCKSVASEPPLAREKKAKPVASVAPSEAAPSPAVPVKVNVAKLVADAPAGLVGAKQLGMALLDKGVDPAELARQLQPRPNDYSRVFGDASAEKARDAYTSHWSTLPAIRPWPAHDEVSVFEVSVERLQAKAGVPHGFPPGYEEIAGQLRPGVTWYSLEFSGKTAGRPSIFDGLVYVDDHWAYFPKPHRLLN